MREIKFRAWNDMKKRMEHDVYKEYENLMQYTGLKDKNGVDIYEGDILKIEGAYFRKTIRENMVVEYDESRAWFGVLDVLHTVSLNNFDCEDDVEVIGNIYENPELLEG
mgnify:CR=1 FL=1